MKRTVQIVGMALVMLLAFTEVDACNHHKQKHHKHKKYIKKGPPVWAQANSYRTVAIHRFTYFPEYNLYFDQRREVFVYLNAGRWMISAELPVFIHPYNLRRAYSVELNLQANNPVAQNAYHMKRYRKYAKRRYYANSHRR